MVVEVGRVAVKLAGRDAGRRCVIVEVLDNQYVLIDGETRRRKCNIAHLEILEQKAEVSQGASHEDLQSTFSDLGFNVWNTKAKESKPKPVRQRTKKETPAAKGKEKKAKPAAKKAVDAKVVESEPQAKASEAKPVKKTAVKKKSAE